MSLSSIPLHPRLQRGAGRAPKPHAPQVSPRERTAHASPNHSLCRQRRPRLAARAPTPEGEGRSLPVVYGTVPSERPRQLKGSDGQMSPDTGVSCAGGQGSLRQHCPPPALASLSPFPPDRRLAVAHEPSRHPRSRSGACTAPLLLKREWHPLLGWSPIPKAGGESRLECQPRPPPSPRPP